MELELGYLKFAFTCVDWTNNYEYEGVKNFTLVAHWENVCCTLGVRGLKAFFLFLAVATSIKSKVLLDPTLWGWGGGAFDIFCSKSNTWPQNVLSLRMTTKTHKIPLKNHH